MKKSGGAVAIIFYLLPLLVMAQGSGWASPPTTTGPITSVANETGSLLTLINTILYWVSGAFWIIAGIFIFYAAYLYLTASGDEKKISQSHSQLLYGVIAIIIGLIAAGLPYLINQFLQGK